MHTQCFKYRLLPTPAQETLLRRTLAVCRDVYNSLLNERRHDYEAHGASPSRYAQQKHFPAWSKMFPEVGAVFSQILQNVAVRLDSAYKAFFRRVEAGETPGFPRVKGDVLPATLGGRPEHVPLCTERQGCKRRSQVCGSEPCLDKPGLFGL